MGEHAQPTPADRAETRDLARRIVESVRNDVAMPWPDDLKEAWLRRGFKSLADMWEAFVFRLAQEIEFLADEEDTCCSCNGPLTCRACSWGSG